MSTTDPLTIDPTLAACPDCGSTPSDYRTPTVETMPNGVIMATICERCPKCGCACPKYTARGAWDIPVLVNDCARCRCTCHVEARRETTAAPPSSQETTR